MRLIADDYGRISSGAAPVSQAQRGLLPARGGSAGRCHVTRVSRMKNRLFVVVDAALPAEQLHGCQEMCRQLADYIDQPVEFAAVNEKRLADVRSVLGK